MSNGASEATRQWIRRIQRAYPRIWHHCHTQHPGRGDELSQRESTVLSHLSGEAPQEPAVLAKHLGIATSTLSEAVDKLVGRGLAERIPDPRDGRRVRYATTEAGEQRLADSSVLSSQRLAEVMQRIPAEQREAAATGLELIAAACLATAELPA